MRLSGFDGKRIAIVLRRDDHTSVLHGTATYERDQKLGNILTIHIDTGRGETQGNPELVIAEDRWRGKLVADTQHGCEYKLELCDL